MTDAVNDPIFGSTTELTYAADPKFPYAYFNLASTIGDTTEEARCEVIELYSKAVEFDPKHGFAFLYRGQTYLDLNKYDAAMADCKSARKCPNMDLLQVEMLQF